MCGVSHIASVLNKLFLVKYKQNATKKKNVPLSIMDQAKDSFLWLSPCQQWWNSDARNKLQCKLPRKQVVIVLHNTLPTSNNWHLSYILKQWSYFWIEQSFLPFCFPYNFSRCLLSSYWLLALPHLESRSCTA